MSECETVAMAKQLSGDSVTVARSDAVFPAISEFVKIRIGICRATREQLFLSLPYQYLAAPDSTRRERGGNQTGICSSFGPLANVGFTKEQ